MAGPRSYEISFVPRNRYLAIISAAALVLCLIELTDVVQLPFENVLGGVASRSLISTGSLVSLVSGQGYLSVFVLMALESASLPIPSEIVLPYAGYLVYQGSMNLYLAIAVGTAALVVGALFDYFLALKLGRPVVDGFLKRLGVKPESVDRAERWMNTRGSWSVLIARFIPGIRSSISIPAGLFDMALKPFFLMTLVGSFAWSAILILAGFSAGPLWGRAMASSAVLLDALLLWGVLAISVVYIGYFLVTTSLRRQVGLGQSGDPLVNDP